ncbi:MAG: SIMPL domain-containing protein [Actinobacteria bacterium]|nr:SIMPL domain-containing protein [Actinomycetota bacterium]
MKPLRVLVAVALLLVAAALAGVGQPQPARGQQPEGPPRSITASGIGSVTTVPDRAHFSFGVQAQSRTASQALEAADVQLSRVVAALRAAGIAQADIQTEQISLSPRTSEDGVQIVGYIAVSSVSVRVRNLDRAGPVVDAAVGAGANQVYGPSLTRSDQAAVYRNALRAAYADARARAQALAEAAGVTLGAMSSTVEGGGNVPMPLAAAREDAKATVEPGTQEIQASVTVTFSVS